MEIRLFEYERVPFGRRSLRCKVGAHPLGELTSDDVAAASQVCPDCNTIVKFGAEALIECIKTRKHMVLRRYPGQPIRGLTEVSPQSET